MYHKCIFKLEIVGERPCCVFQTYVKLRLKPSALGSYRSDLTLTDLTLTATWGRRGFVSALSVQVPLYG